MNKIFSLTCWVQVLLFSTVACSRHPREAQMHTAIPAISFVNSIGICTHMGHNYADGIPQTVVALNYSGFRCVREGDNASPGFVTDLIRVHDSTTTHVKFVLTKSGPDEAWMTDVIKASRSLHRAGALLAMEGPNEPSTYTQKGAKWAVTFQAKTSYYTFDRNGKSDGGDWLPVARWQQEFYRRCKADSILKYYPVWHPSYSGGSPNNVGLQFLVIPGNAGTLMPDGTKYSDMANMHNYICRVPKLHDNMAWQNASSEDVRWDSVYIAGPYREHVRTWMKGFRGYTEAWSLPKVTTETGWPSGSDSGKISEEQQGRLYLNIYLSQFRQGYKYTILYMLRETDDEPGFGFFDKNWNPKKAAVYLHNLTAILNDKDSIKLPGKLAYLIKDPPNTVHDLLLQKNDGRFFLCVWNERTEGSDNVNVEFDEVLNKVNIYDPVTGASPVRVLNKVSSLTLTLGDHPNIIEILP